MPPEWYQICVQGVLPADWSDWFEGLEIQRGPHGETILSGPLADQAALHGVLAKIRDLNLKLISVTHGGSSAQYPGDEHIGGSK